jgi:hypothetical protein
MSSLIQRSAALFSVMSLALAVNAAPNEKAGLTWPMRVVAHCSAQPSDSQREQLRLYMGKVKKTVHRYWFPPKDGSPCMVKFVIDSTGVTKNTSVSRHCESYTEQAALRAVEKAAPYFPALDEPLRSIEIEFPFAFPFADPSISIVIDKPTPPLKAQ